MTVEEEEKDETLYLLQNRNWISSETYSGDTFETEVRHRSPLATSYESPLHGTAKRIEELSARLKESIQKQSPGSPGYRTLYSKHNLRTSSPPAVRHQETEEEPLHRTPEMSTKGSVPNKFQLY